MLPNIPLLLHGSSSSSITGKSILDETPAATPIHAAASMVISASAHRSASRSRYACAFLSLRQPNAHAAASNTSALPIRSLSEIGRSIISTNLPTARGSCICRSPTAFAAAARTGSLGSVSAATRIGDARLRSSRSRILLKASAAPVRTCGSVAVINASRRGSTVPTNDPSERAAAARSATGLS